MKTPLYSPYILFYWLANLSSWLHISTFSIQDYFPEVLIEQTEAFASKSPHEVVQLNNFTAEQSFFCNLPTAIIHNLIMNLSAEFCQLITNTKKVFLSDFW